LEANKKESFTRIRQDTDRKKYHQDEAILFFLNGKRVKGANQKTKTETLKPIDWSTCWTGS